MIDVTAAGDLGLSWDLEPSHFPDPLTRWSAELFSIEQTRAIGELVVRYGLVIDGVAMKEFDGRVYSAVVPLGGKQRKPPPALLVPLLCRVVPELRRRIARLKESDASDELAHVAERWLAEDEPRMLAQGRAQLARDLDGL